MPVIGTSTASSGWATTYNFQHKLFFANGLLWVFYSDGTDLVYRTSLDNYADATVFRTVGGGLGHRFSCWVTPDNKMRYAFNVAGAGDDTLYRRGTLNANGTITWDAAEQTVVTITSPRSVLYPRVITDSNGYDWVTQIEMPNGFPDTPFDGLMYKNANKDGTWAAAAGYPITYISGYETNYPAGILVPLTGGKMYLIFGGDANGSIVRGQLYNGSSWEALANITGATGVDTAMNAVPDGDNVHFVTINRNAGDNNILDYYKYTYGTGWGSATTIQGPEAGNPYGHVGITRIGTNSIVVFWMGSPTVDHVYYREMINNAWQTRVDWIDESTDTISDTSFNALPASNADMRAALIYTTKAASPFNINLVILPVLASGSFTGTTRRRFYRDPSCMLYLPLYKLDGGKFMSRDAYGRLCTVTGAIWGNQGRTFDGDDVIDVGSPLDYANNFSICAWVKRQDTTLAYMNILSSTKEFDATKGYITIIWGAAGANANKIAFQSNGTWYYSSHVVDDTNWHFIVFTLSPANVLTIFKDGVSDGGQAAQAVVTGLTANALIGKQGEASGNYWKGQIGECLFVTRSLAGVEVTQILIDTNRYA